MFVTTVSSSVHREILQNCTVHEVDLPSLGYVRAEMNVHAFMNELDQKDYCYENVKTVKNL